MKHTIILLSGILFMGLASCKTKSKSESTSSSKTTTKSSTTATTTAASNTDVQKTVSDNACAVEVAFGSPGTGIDGAAYDKVIALIESKNVKYTSKNIGREGEKLFCLPLTELKDAAKTDFIEQLKKIAAAGQFVSVSVR